MATFFVVSDVHGFYDIMMKSLDEAGFDINNKNHIFVSLGDLLDRGEQPQQCLEFVNSLPKNRKILIKGNHESLIEECINRREFLAHDYHNGTVLTMDLLAQSPENIIDQMAQNPLWLNYVTSCIDYYENSKYIFVHGWIPCKRIISGKDLFERYHYVYRFNPTWRSGDWEQARWLNGMDCWDKGIRIPSKRP